MATIAEVVRNEIARLRVELDIAERTMIFIQSGGSAGPVMSNEAPRAKKSAKAAITPKRVRSEATKAKHKATLAAKRAAANGAAANEPSPALDAE
jgi:hypothetical protein